MAELICFPQQYNVGKARHVAALISRRQGRDRDTYFRGTCQRLAAVLRRAGFDDEEVNRQVTGFTSAVTDAIAQGWHYPGKEADFSEAHRILDESTSEAFDSPRDQDGPGAA